MILKLSGTALLGSLLLALIPRPCHAADTVYAADLQPLNASKIGASASGKARLDVTGGKFIVSIDLAGLPPGMHLQHFHGFPDGKDAACPTGENDANGDGYIDLIETEAVAGTTMVPFHAHPATLEIPSDTYPVADENGAAHYEKTEVVADLEKRPQGKIQGARSGSGEARDLRAWGESRHGAARQREIPPGRAGACDHTHRLRQDRSRPAASLARLCRGSEVKRRRGTRSIPIPRGARTRCAPPSAGGTTVGAAQAISCQLSSEKN